MTDDVQRRGWPVAGWSGAARPARVALPGRYVTLEPVSAQRHSAALYEALHDPRDPGLWDYLPAGPFAAPDAAWDAWVASCEELSDPQFFALVDARDGLAKGIGSYLRIEPAHGSIEIGYLTFGAAIQRTPLTTEAIHLWARHAFADLGYRRLEWKCNALNARSMAAAPRLGFTYEGTFRQHQVIKGRNRDTAWFAILDHEWPALDAAFTAWLDPENFDAGGRQRRSLASLRADRRSGE